MADPVVEFVLHEPRERVERLAEALADNRIILSATRSQLAFAFVHGPKSLERMLELLSSWREAGGTAALLARVLRAQLEIRRTIEDRGPRVELVWTGDTPAGAGVRSTLPVVKEMLSWSRRSVMVVAYSLWIGSGDAGDIVDRLAQLSSSGVDVTFVLDARYEKGRNLRQLWARWPEQRRRPTVYSWQHEDDELAKLHAKVVIVDRHDVLITSANLTGHGMGRNLEIGLRAYGKPAEDAADHFDELIKAGTFQPVEWGSGG